jgi:hypothetical protein
MTRESGLRKCIGRLPEAVACVITRREDASKALLFIATQGCSTQGNWLEECRIVGEDYNVGGAGMQVVSTNYECLIWFAPNFLSSSYADADVRIRKHTACVWW